MQATLKMPAAMAAFAAAIAVLAPQQVAAGQKVGVAAAVTPQAASKPPGGSTKTLKIGKSVFYNERITTSASGVVQVLLVDGSTFTVGPGSNLVIDKFVYDPKSGTGALTATLSKGALRFVGGKLSKQEPGVKVKTPAGELSVRGGIFQGIVRSANQAVFAFVFGDRLSLVRHGRRYTLNQTGNLFAIGNSGPPVIRKTTTSDATLILAAISGRSWNTYKIKASAWPFYYGAQPTGRYPDQPFVRELYYNGANPIKLHRMPEPASQQPRARNPAQHSYKPPVRVPRQPRRPPRTPAVNPVDKPRVTCPNC